MLAGEPILARTTQFQLPRGEFRSKIDGCDGPLFARWKQMKKIADHPREKAGTSPRDGTAKVPLWMRSVPDTPTLEEVADLKAWIAALYSDDVVQEIIQKSRFTTEKDTADTKEFLLKAGYWYIDHKHERHPGASYSADRAQLKTIATAASDLANLLQGLSEVSAQALWHRFHHSWQFAHPLIEHDHKTEFGLTIKKYQQQDGSIAIHHLKPADIEEALDVLGRLAAIAADTLPAQKGGQPQDPNRQSWIASAMHFWREHSTVAFGYRSVAFDFCYLGFRKLDPNASREQIASAMRAASKEFARYGVKPGRPGSVQEPR